MTEAEKTIARELHRCAFVPGSGTKRFAREMAFNADQPEPRPLTPKQRTYLLTAAVRFRRQMPGAVVELARREMST